MIKSNYLYEGLKTLPENVKKQLHGLIQAHVTARKDLEDINTWNRILDALTKEPAPDKFKTIYVIFDKQEDKLLTKKKNSARFKDVRFFKLRHIAERYIEVNLSNNKDRYKICELNISCQEALCE